jgi:hypothetical protein
MEPTRRIEIWFFIGLLLLVYGVLILGAGVYHFVYPPPSDIALRELHSDLWWGALLMVLGGFYCVKFRPSRTIPGEKDESHRDS